MKTLRYGLAVVVALVFSALFSMHFFHEGTSISKYVTKQLELDRVKEVEVSNYTDMVLYGDELETVSEDVDLSERAGSEEGFQLSQQVREIDNYILLALMVVAWVMLIPVCHRCKAFSFVYVLLGLYLLLLSYCKSLNGGAAYSEWAIFAHAARWLPCFALFLWLYLKPQSGWGSYTAVRWMLIVSIALTFATHGLEAFLIHPSFRDLLMGVTEHMPWELSETSCHVVLRSIGVMDLMLALVVLFYQRKEFFLWMAVWGGLTALSRPIAFGDILWEDALLRCGNSLVPLILYLWIRQLNKSNENGST